MDDRDSMCVIRMNGPGEGCTEITDRCAETRPQTVSRPFDSMSGASAADVRSILSLPTAQPQPKKTAAPLARKPSGISRELYSLIGPSAPTLVAQVAKPRLKQKPNLGGGGSTKWSVFSSNFNLAKFLTCRAGCGGLSKTLREQMASSSAIGSKRTRIQILVCLLRFAKSLI
jgi:hypothetical protein